MLEKPAVFLALFLGVGQLWLFECFVTDCVEVVWIRRVEFDPAGSFRFSLGLGDKLEALHSFVLINFWFVLVLDIDAVCSFLLDKKLFEKVLFFGLSLFIDHFFKDEVAVLSFVVFLSHFLYSKLFLIFYDSHLYFFLFLLLSFELKILCLKILKILKADGIVGVFSIGHLFEPGFFLLDFFLNMLFHFLNKERFCFFVVFKESFELFFVGLNLLFAFLFLDLFGLEFFD